MSLEKWGLTLRYLCSWNVIAKHMSCRELSLAGLCVVLLFLYLFTFMDGLPQQYPELNDCDDIMSIYIMLMFFLVDDFPSFTSSADPE